jgi:hypothetical protein
MATCNYIPELYVHPGQVAVPDQKTAMNGARMAGKMHANAAARVRPDHGDASTAALHLFRLWSRRSEWLSGTGQGDRSWLAGQATMASAPFELSGSLSRPSRFQGHRAVVLAGHRPVNAPLRPAHAYVASNAGARSAVPVPPSIAMDPIVVPSRP